MQFGTKQDLQKDMGERSMFGKEDCPFCKEFGDRERVLWKGMHWAIIYNKYPYIRSNQHIMLTPLRHVCFSHEIDSVEQSELTEVYHFIHEFYRDQPYFSFTRESFNERSVAHLHTHFIPGKLRRASVVRMLTEQGFESDDI